MSNISGTKLNVPTITQLAEGFRDGLTAVKKNPALLIPIGVTVFMIIVIWDGERPILQAISAHAKMPFAPMLEMLMGIFVVLLVVPVLYREAARRG